MKPDLTKEEELAIRSLKRLAKKWPKSLQLFSWSGSLTVLKAERPKDLVSKWYPVSKILGISNDGGDPETGIDEDGEQYCL